MRRVLFGVLAVMFLAGLTVPALAAQGGPRDDRKGEEKPGISVAALKPSAKAILAAKKYQLYRQQMNRVMDTFRTIHSAYGTDRGAGPEASAFLEEERCLPEIITQLSIIKTFLAGQNDKGKGNIDYWTRSCTLLSIQGRSAANMLREILNTYQGRINPLLSTAIANVADNLGRAMDKFNTTRGYLEYWIEAAGYLRDSMWQSSSNIQGIIDTVPCTVPADAMPLVKGQLRIIQGLLTAQNVKGNGEVEYWIRTYRLLAMQANLIIGILRDILGRHSTLPGLLITSIRNVVENLEQMVTRHNKENGDVDYWMSAADFLCDALNAAGRNLKDISNSF